MKAGTYGLFLNGRLYYNACQGPAWEVLLKDAGHFQLLDTQSMLQRAVCAVGPIDDSAVRNLAQVCASAMPLLQTHLCIPCFLLALQAALVYIFESCTTPCCLSKRSIISSRKMNSSRRTTLHYPSMQQFKIGWWTCNQ